MRHDHGKAERRRLRAGQKAKENRIIRSSHVWRRSKGEGEIDIASVLKMLATRKWIFSRKPDVPVKQP